MEASHSALVVTIPEAERVVAPHRERLDQAASWGVPAHVTVLFPFLPPDEIDEQVLATLGRAAATVPAFFVALDRLGWFGERVVWLAPSPAEPFQRLTAAVTSHFPGVQPYDGAFDEVVPHLTLGHDHPVDVLKAAAVPWVGIGDLGARSREFLWRLASPAELLELALEAELSEECAAKLRAALGRIGPVNWEAEVEAGEPPALALGGERRLSRRGP